MKRLIFLFALLCAGPLYGEVAGRDGGALPAQGNQIGYKGADGKFHYFQGPTSGGAIYTTPLTATTVKSTAFEASRVLKNAAGSLVSFHCYNSSASSQFILIMDSATVPANGAVTLLYPPIAIPAGANISLTFPVPLVAANGISVSNSSTGTFTKTIGAADCVFVAQVQ